jgi:hypothetical protein
MRTLVLNPPTFGFIVATRVALAAGVGLLVASRLPESRRRAIGAALVAIGAATTIPAVLSLRRASGRGKGGTERFGDRDERLIGAVRFPRKGDDVGEFHP